MGNGTYRSMIMESSVYSYIASLILLWNQVTLIESSVNLALHKSTSQSTDFGGFPSSNAVDGLKKQCVTDGFAHTLNGDYEWWQVDLGEMCEIRRIQIYYRTNFLNRLDGYAINITKSLNPLETWQCYKDTDNTIPTNPAPSHICPSLGRYVKFSKEKTIPDLRGDKAVISLCELEVYGCPQGRYGNSDCNSNCSVGCLNSRCDPDNGQCNCRRDWTGVKCERCTNGYYLHGGRCVRCPTGCLDNTCNVGNGECAKECKPSFYGTFCNLTCPTNCYNTSCARDSGQCIGCREDFYGDKCDKKCQWNCKDNICKQYDGYCTRCYHSYQGNKCTECVDGYFGDPCTPCSKGCVNSLCRKNDGYCTDGCKNGFFDDFCNQSCPANCKQNKCDRQTGDCSDGCRTVNFLGNRCNVCVNGLYGKDCEIACPDKCKNKLCDGKHGTCIFGCVNGLYGNHCDIACPVNCKHKVCDEIDGICILGCKNEHITGNQCDGIRTSTEEQAFQIKSYIGSIIAGVVSLINIVFIAVILVLYCKRRRRKETVYENQKPLDWSQEGRNQQDNYNLEQQQTVHYETLGLDDRGGVNANSAEGYTGLNVNTEGRY